MVWGPGNEKKAPAVLTTTSSAKLIPRRYWYVALVNVAAMAGVLKLGELLG